MHGTWCDRVIELESTVRSDLLKRCLYLDEQDLSSYMQDGCVRGWVWRMSVQEDGGCGMAVQDGAAGSLCRRMVVEEDVGAGSVCRIRVQGGVQNWGAGGWVRRVCAGCV